ncbi:hypothetical protein ACOSP7_015561 [Xanthoceras sorbifolium]
MLLCLWDSSLLSGPWCCSMRHVFKECNYVADCLAKAGLSCNRVPVTVFDSPPPCAEYAYARDMEGLVAVRLLGSAS